jgi:hypothetical protein
MMLYSVFSDVHVICIRCILVKFYSVFIIAHLVYIWKVSMQCGLVEKTRMLCVIPWSGWHGCYVVFHINLM